MYIYFTVVIITHLDTSDTGVDKVEDDEQVLSARAGQDQVTAPHLGSSQSAKCSFERAEKLYDCSPTAYCIMYSHALDVTCRTLWARIVDLA